jgi:hypothetical protein
MPGAQVGDVIPFYVVPTGNFIATVAIGTGGTLVGIGAGAARTVRVCLIRITNVGAPAYTLYCGL